MKFQLQKHVIGRCQVKKRRMNHVKERCQLVKKSRITEENGQIIESHLQHIPQEIVDNIFSRLPVKSLLRFKSVCKLWHSTISDPYFFKRESKSVFAMEISSKGFFPLSIDEKATKEDIPLPRANRVNVSNSCNGMVLIRRNISLFLFNPSTRYSFKVPTLHCLDKFDYGVCIGLCYDESISDYKVVIKPVPPSPNYGLWPVYYGPFVIVASLKGKQWALVSFPFNSDYVREGPVLKGQLHWVVCESSNGLSAGKKIIGFDPVWNVFKELPSPLPKSGDKNAIVGLGVLEGCLWMARRKDTNYSIGDVEVLAMKEYGVGESWTTMLVLSNLEVDRHKGNLIPLHITKDGEVLISTACGIWAYNLAKKSYRRFYKPNIGNRLIYAVSLVENIVSPIGY